MDDVVRYPYLLKRGNAFSFRAKVPADLVQAFGGKRQIWESLRTSDPSEAKRRVRDRTDAFERQCERLRERIDGEAIGTIGLTSLSEAEIEALVRRWFAEGDAERERRFRTTLIEKAASREEAIADAEFWQSVHLGQVDSHDGQYELFYAAMKLLRANDICMIRRKLDPIRAKASPLPFTVSDRDAASTQYGQLLALIRRAELESLRRDVERLKGNFANIGFDPVFKEPMEGGKSVAAIIAAFRSAPERSALVAKSRGSFDVTFGLMEEVFGSNRPLATVSRDDCRTFLARVHELPANARQRHKGKSLVEAIEATRGMDVPRLHATTINHYLHSLSAVMNFAVREGWIDANPARGLATKFAKQRNGRDPFTIEELKLIFGAPLFRGCMNGREGYDAPGHERPRNGRFWLPLIALYTGMRQGEIAQLHSADVAAYQGVPCILIRPSKDMDDADLKRVKTEAGVRFVPIHPQLLELGFLSFSDERTRAGDVRLFPDLERGSDGYFSPFSKWFSRFLVKAGVKHRRNGFHSFRHTFRDAMSDAEFPHDAIVALGGWQKGGLEHRYGRGASAPLLLKHLTRLRYSGLDLSGLTYNGPADALDDRPKTA